MRTAGAPQPPPGALGSIICPWLPNMSVHSALGISLASCFGLPRQLPELTLSILSASDPVLQTVPRELCSVVANVGIFLSPGPLRIFLSDATPPSRVRRPPVGLWCSAQTAWYIRSGSGAICIFLTKSLQHRDCVPPAHSQQLLHLVPFMWWDTFS